MWRILIFVTSIFGFVQSFSIYEVALYKIVKCDCTNRTADLDVSKIKVYVYNFQTNMNDTYSIGEAADKILNRTDFNASQCVHIFIPGFHSTIDGKPSQTTRCIFSQINCNGVKPLAIILDHSEYTDANNLLLEIDLVNLYKKSVRYAKSIGLAISTFIIRLLDVIDRNNIDIIGHSLGGQIAGYVGDFVKNKTGSLLKRLYVTDAAGPCYEDCPSEHIKSGEAELVVAIHCNAGQLGTKLNLVDYDFYSKNGVTQDTCIGGGTPGVILPGFSSFCSHERCVSIAENPAIKNDIWKSVKCSSANNYLSGQCDNNETAYAGYTIIPTSSQGVYYFTPTKNLTCQA